MNNRIRILGLIFVGMIFVWGIGTANAQTVNAPSDLTITAVTQFSVSLAWSDNAVDETHYEFERSIDGLFWVKYPNLPADTNNYKSGGLACATTYQFRVRVYRSADSSYSTWLYSNNITTNTCASPVPPSDLSITGQTQFQVSLSWTDNELDETHYQVERSSNNGTSWVQLSSLPPNTTSLQAGGLTCGSNYLFRVRVRRNLEYSDYSNILTATTSACVPPTPVGNLTVTGVTDFTISLSWEDNDTSETNYNVQRSIDGINWTLTSTLTNTGTTISNLNCEIAYQIRVRTEYPNGVYAVSNTITATTATCPPPPTAPTDLVITGTSSSTVSLSWIDNASNETEYRIQRSGDNGANWTNVGAVAKNSTNYTSTGINCELNYQFRIYAYRFNDNVSSDYSNVVSITLTECTPPAPTNLTSVAKTQTTMDLVWTDNSTSETSYRLERSYNGTNWTQIAELPANTTSYQDTGLTCSTLYWYRLRTHRNSDNVYSSYSVNYVTYTSYCPLVTPSNLRITSQTTSSLNLAWDDNSINETYYRIERSVDGGANWTQIAQRPANTTSYSGAGISCLGDNIYRVYAYRSDGNSSSSPSNTVMAYTTPCTPTGLVASNRDYYSISLSWLDNAYNESEYRLERSDDASASWNEIAVLPANSTNYVDTGLSCSTGYHYRLRAYRSSDEVYTAYTSVLIVVTDTCPPPVPSNVTASVGNSWINLSWSYPATNFSTVTIEKSSDWGATWQQLTFFNNSTTTTYSDSGLSCEVTFLYRLRTGRWTGNGNVYSDYSTPLTATTDTCPPPPLAPTNVTATQNGYQILITWEDNEPHLANYRLERSLDNGLTWTSVTSSISGDATSYSVGSLICSTDYMFRMQTRRTVPLVEQSEYSNIASARSWECDPPETPTNLAAVVSGDDWIDLTWTDGGTKETAFSIEWSEDGTNYSFLDAIGANDSDYRVGYYPDLIFCGRTYYFRVRSYRNDLRLYSAYSNVATATTSACPPPPNAASNLQVTSNTLAGVGLSWTDNSNNEDYFAVERSDDNGVTWGAWGGTDPNVTTYLDDLTFECKLFYYRVVATIRGVEGIPSNVVSVVSADCDPIEPSNFTATFVNLTTVSLIWDDNASGETSYEILKTTVGGYSEYLPSLAANATNYTDTNVQCGKSYQYQLRADRTTDNSSSAWVSANITMPTCPTTPATPTNVQRSIVNPSEIQITWDDNATNETNYRIERLGSDGLTWTTVADIVANAESYNITALSCGMYRYRVSAFIADYLVFSDAVMTTYVTILCTPTNLTVERTSQSSVVLSWDSVFAAHDYSLEYSSDAGATWQVAGMTEFAATQYTISGLACGTNYQFRVRAYESFEDSYSDYSSILSASTQDCYGLSDAMCTLEQINLSHPSTNILGPIFMSANGNRIAINYQAAPIVSTYPAGMYLYDIASETVVQDFADAAFGDISADGSRLVLMSSANPVGQNADGNEEIFYWKNGTYTQLTNTTIADAVGHPQMSDDGSVVVFVGDGDVVGDATAGTFLYIWDSTNGVRKLIPQAGVGDLALSGDGSTVVFVHGSALSGQAGLGSRQLYRWNATDGVQLLYALTNPQSFNGGSFALHINHDGSRIAFVDKNDPLSLNPDGTDDVFLWDETDGLQQLTESSEHIGFLAGMDGSGERIAFFTGLDLDTDSTAPSSIGYYFFDAGYGFSQITSVPIGDWTTLGQALSADGSKAAFIASVGWDGVSSVYPYLEVFVGDCTPANNFPEPTNLTATLNGTSIDLAWEDNASSETEYRIERSADGITWTAFTAPYNSTSYSDTTVVCETTYDYRVRAYRSSDNAYSDYSNLATETSIACPPLAPTALSITGTSQTSISLAWTDNSSDETSFALERSSNGGTTWTEIQSLAADSSSHTDSSLTCNTGYSYRLRAYRSGDNQYSSYSNVVSGSTALCPVAPPTGLVVTSTGHTNVNLAWTDNSSDEANFVLERSADSGANWTEIAQPAANSTSYNDTSALCNTSYDYRLRAFRSADSQHSAYSNVVTATTDICITLNAASDIQQTANGQTGMSLSWTDNSLNESGYEIERSADGSTWQLLSSLPADSTSYTDSGLSCSTGYYYRVRSNHLGTGAYSPYATSGSLMTAACPPLVASVLSTTGTTQNSISLSWTVDNNATSFTLAFYNGSTWQNLGIFASSTTTYTHTGLLCGNNYQYRITTFRSNDSASLNSDTHLSSTAACPPLVAPNAPVLVDAQPALIRLQIPTMPATATSMSLERSTDGVTWTNLGAASNFFNDTSVLCGNSYQYRLVAYRSNDAASATSANTVAMTDMCPIPTTLGIFRNGLWLFVESNNTAVPVMSFNNGDSQWQPLVGDWDGDGFDAVGIYRNGEFILRNSTASDATETRFLFGNTEGAWTALVGDWNGDGIDTVGIYKAGLFILSDDNQNIHYHFSLGDGQADWQAVAGDWNADGRDGIGLYRNGRWILVDDVANPTTTMQNLSYGPNQAGWIAVVGDWNGDGFDSIGFFNNGLWRMRVNSIHDMTESSINFGQAGDIPLSIFDND